MIVSVTALLISLAAALLTGLLWRSAKKEADATRLLIQTRHLY